jgi:methylenetetrahydrofolate reductase (NADH)
VQDQVRTKPRRGPGRPPNRSGRCLLRIRDLYDRPVPTISFEYFPPKTAEAEEVLLSETTPGLKKLGPAFISVTYGAGGSTRDNTLRIVNRIRREYAVDAMPHLTCVGHTRDDLVGIMDEIEASGIENVLALRGDPPKGQTTFQAIEGGFTYASELVRFIRQNHGSHFSVGGAAYPEKHIECGNPAVDLVNLKRKAEEGVDFLITQLFFDNRRYFEFVERARKSGIRQAIVPGIMPITNASQVERFTVACGASLPFDLAEELDRRRNDPAAVMELGIAHAIEQCVDLLKKGAPGNPLLHAQSQSRHGRNLSGPPQHGPDDRSPSRLSIFFIRVHSCAFVAQLVFPVRTQSALLSIPSSLPGTFFDVRLL